MEILLTPRLLLRPFTMDDAPLLLELNSDPEVQRYTGDIVMTEISEAEARIAMYLNWMETVQMARLGVFLRETNEFIGWCGLIPQHGEVDLGYRFMVRYWGKGYGTEAAKAVLEWAWRTLPLSYIIGRAEGDNVASCKILEKIGMSYEGDGIDERDGVPFRRYVIHRP